MVTKLVAMSGPFREAEFPVVAELAIGRDAKNNIRLEDPAVSPEHCTLAVCDGRIILIDLDSGSGTFVNGIPIKLRELQAGDEVAIGDSVFLLQTIERSMPSGPGDLKERNVAELKPAELQAEEVRHLTPQALAALPPAARLARSVSTLLQICRAIGLLRDEESLPWQLLGLIFDIIPAERGAILLLEEGGQEVRAQGAWDRVAGREHPLELNGAVVRRVIAEGVSLLDSCAGPGTLLCVPMISKDKVIGVIYLESLSTAAALTKDDFHLLTGVASLGVVGIENARQLARLGSENQRLLAEVSLTHDMVGRSPRMREVYKFIERVAPSDSTVLICGESGTGKELAARAIHKNSPRKNQPFVALNCAALTETLLESELFGHEKGAFTSAISQKKGFLEVAEGGTIFLDEIGELSPLLQAKLLRVLQEREFVRVGGTRTIKINVRFLAATNKDLQKAVRDGQFRADLFHRLNVIALALPSLREHREDIPALAQHFCTVHANRCNRDVFGISTGALACLTQYDWPGNIRELENAMERAVVVGSSDMIQTEDLPETVEESAPLESALPATYHRAIRDLKKQLIVNALEQSNGSITEAAKQLGVHANYLHRLLRNLELRGGVKKQTGA
jgi:transcriptional regulator with GAF, ATPase, and Fis domain